MLNKKVRKRLWDFVRKIPVKASPIIEISTYIEKYLRKLKSEGEIQDYSLLGFGMKVSSCDIDVKQESEWYRLTLLFTPDGLKSITIINHNDLEGFEVDDVCN